MVGGVRGDWSAAVMDGAAGREFLGWRREALWLARDRLLERGGAGADLSGWIVVLPSARAGRLLLGLLAERASQEGRPLSPPGIITPGEVPEALFRPAGRPADPVARAIAWSEALRGVPAEVLREAFDTGRDDEGATEADAFAVRRGRAELLAQAHRVLAGEGLTFGSVAAHPETPEHERVRWSALGGIQDWYRGWLEARGWHDPDLARIGAVEGAPTHAAEGVVLIGVLDLPGVARRALERAGVPVEAWVVAPESHAGCFDAWGTVEPEAWVGASLPVEDSQWRRAETPRGQAGAALAWMAGEAVEDPSLTGEDVVIGVPDAEVTGHLERAAGLHEEFRVRDAAGTPLERAAPVVLLDRVAAFVAEGRFDAFCELVRHPDVERYLLRELARPGGGQPEVEWWLDALDGYAEEALPWRFDPAWPGARERSAGVLRALGEAVVGLLGSLMPFGGRREAAAWARPGLEVLQRIYAGREVEPHQPGARLVIEACGRLRDIFERLDALGGVSVEDGAFAGGLPALTAGEALSFVHAMVSREAVAGDPDPEAVEMLGWLELPLEPARVVAVTGMNEGGVPAGGLVDPLLSDGVRRRLGLPDDRRRLARDMAVLASLGGGDRRLLLVYGARSGEGDPLFPSRLMGACDDGALVRRVRRFTGDEATPALAVRVVEGVTPGGVSLFPVAPVRGGETPDSIAVTAFRQYLASPYLFYLRHVLRLREREPVAEELDGGGFGTLMHGALQRFGVSEEAASDDEARIIGALEAHLHDEAAARYGSSRSAGVALQVEIARRRLEAFGVWQAGQVREGWRIEHVEWTPDGGSVRFDVDGVACGLRGKIDRIDRHEGMGAWRVLDYKTGERADSPASAHRGRDGRWKDLQLPLYRHLAAQVLGGDMPELGYVTIPRDAGKGREGAESVAWKGLGWDEALHAEADECARQVVRNVREGRFDALGDCKHASGAVAALCGEGLIGVSSAPAKGDAS